MHKLSIGVELGFVMETVYILGTARTPMGGLQQMRQPVSWGAWRLQLHLRRHKFLLSRSMSF